MFAKEALTDRPALRQHSGFLQPCVRPVDRNADVFHAMAVGRIVLHNLSGADTALDVDLVEYGGAVFGHSEAVIGPQALDNVGGEDCLKKLLKRRFWHVSERFAHNLRRQFTNGSLRPRARFIRTYGVARSRDAPGLFALQPVRGLSPILLPGTGLWVLTEPVGRGLVIGAAGFMVTPAYGGVEDIIPVIYVWGEAVGPLAVGASEPGGFPGILAKVILVVHGLFVFVGQFLLFREFLVFRFLLGRNAAGTGRVAEFLGLLQLAVDGSRREAGLVGNLADGLVLGLEVDEFLQVLGFGEFVLLTELGGFLDIVLEDELRVSLDLLQLVEDDVVGVVLVFSGADLDLLDVAPGGVFGRAADGNSGVEEVDEFR